MSQMPNNIDQWIGQLAQANNALATAASNQQAKLQAETQVRTTAMQQAGANQRQQAAGQQGLEQQRLQNEGFRQHGERQAAMQRENQQWRTDEAKRVEKMQLLMTKWMEDLKNQSSQSRKNYLAAVAADDVDVQEAHREEMMGFARQEGELQSEIAALELVASALQAQSHGSGMPGEGLFGYAKKQVDEYVMAQQEKRTGSNGIMEQARRAIMASLQETPGEDRLLSSDLVRGLARNLDLSGLGLESADEAKAQKHVEELLSLLSLHKLGAPGAEISPEMAEMANKGAAQHYAELQRMIGADDAGFLIYVIEEAIQVFGKSDLAEAGLPEFVGGVEGSDKYEAIWKKFKQRMAGLSQTARALEGTEILIDGKAVRLGEGMGMGEMANWVAPEEWQMVVPKAVRLLMEHGGMSEQEVAALTGDSPEEIRRIVMELQDAYSRALEDSVLQAEGQHADIRTLLGEADTIGEINPLITGRRGQLTDLISQRETREGQITEGQKRRALEMAPESAAVDIPDELLEMYLQ